MGLSFSDTNFNNLFKMHVIFYGNILVNMFLMFWWNMISLGEWCMVYIVVKGIFRVIWYGKI